MECSSRASTIRSENRVFGKVSVVGGGGVLCMHLPSFLLGLALGLKGSRPMASPWVNASNELQKRKKKHNSI